MRLKIFTFFILFLFLTTSSNAQCDIVNGSYEEWFTTDFVLPDGGNGQASGDVILPVGSTPFIRLLFLSFAALFDPTYGMLLETEAQGLSGISQSTDASDGDFAIKLQAGYGVEVADIYSVNACTEIPEQFNFDVKHHGESGDTLSVFVIFDQGLNGVPQSEDDLVNFPAYASTQMIYNTNTEYETVTIPVIQNFGAPVDTFYYLIIAETLSDTSYFLIDGVNFDGDSGCQIEASVLAYSGESSTCICNGFEITFPLEYSIDDPSYEYNELIINAEGTILSIDTFDEGNHDEFCTEDENLQAVIITYEVGTTGINEGSNINDLEGCFALSNAVNLNTSSIDPFEFNLFIDGEQQGLEFSICNKDDIIEVISFAAEVGSDSIAILVINLDTELLEIRIQDVNETTTLMDLEPGEYVIGAIRYDQAFNLDVGQPFDMFSSEGCYVPSDEGYYVTILGPDDNCVTNIEETVVESISIRPNFSTGIYEIYNPNNATFQYDIRNVSGQLIQLQKRVSNGRIDLSDYPNGMYIVTFTLNGEQHLEKIVKF